MSIGREYEYLKQLYPRDIAQYILDLLIESYLMDWKSLVMRVHISYKEHIGMTTYYTENYKKVRVCSLIWTNHKDETPDDYDHDISIRGFNHRFLDTAIDNHNRVKEMPKFIDNHHRLVHISHVPTQTSTMVRLPENYYRIKTLY